MGQRVYPETSVTNYQFTLRNIQEEPRSQGYISRKRGNHMGLKRANVTRVLHVIFCSEDGCGKLHAALLVNTSQKTVFFMYQRMSSPLHTHFSVAASMRALPLLYYIPKWCYLLVVIAMNWVAGIAQSV
jgi:hypothetical protein